MIIDMEKTEKLAHKVFSTTAVLNDYCKTHADEELLERIVPIMAHLHQDADKLYSQFFGPDE